MTTELAERLLPCRACGSPCRVERFEASRYLCQPVDLWICSANEKFGGNCPDGMAYLSAEAWNDRPLSPSPARGVETVERQKFPVLGSGGQTVDWQFVADHGKQAQRNHYQSVERLAERGGLSWCELAAVVGDREYRKMEQADAINAVRAAEAKYLSAISTGVKEREAMRQRILIWLGVYRDHLPTEAVRSLQDIADALKRGDHAGGGNG